MARFAQRYVTKMDDLYERFNAYFGHSEGDADAKDHIVDRGREEEVHKLKEEAEMVGDAQHPNVDRAGKGGGGYQEEKLADEYMYENEEEKRGKKQRRRKRH